jgi:hypothetical protein
VMPSGGLGKEGLGGVAVSPRGGGDHDREDQAPPRSGVRPAARRRPPGQGRSTYPGAAGCRRPGPPPPRHRGSEAPGPGRRPDRGQGAFLTVAPAPDPPLPVAPRGRDPGASLRTPPPPGPAAPGAAAAGQAPVRPCRWRLLSHCRSQLQCPAVTQPAFSSCHHGFLGWRRFAGAGQQRAGLVGRDRCGRVLADVSARLHERFEVLALYRRLHGGQQHRHRPARVRCLGEGLDGGEEQGVACEVRRRYALCRPKRGPTAAQRILSLTSSWSGLALWTSSTAAAAARAACESAPTARQVNSARAGRTHLLTAGASRTVPSSVSPAEMQPRDMPGPRRKYVNSGSDQRPHSGPFQGSGHVHARIWVQAARGAGCDDQRATHTAGPLHSRARHTVPHATGQCRPAGSPVRARVRLYAAPTERELCGCGPAELDFLGRFTAQGAAGGGCRRLGERVRAPTGPLRPDTPYEYGRHG